MCERERRGKRGGKREKGERKEREREREFDELSKCFACRKPKFCFFVFGIWFGGHTL